MADAQLDFDVSLAQLVSDYRQQKAQSQYNKDLGGAAVTRDQTSFDPPPYEDAKDAADEDYQEQYVAWSARGNKSLPSRASS